MTLTPDGSPSSPAPPAPAPAAPPADSSPADPTVVATGNGKADGLDKCPKCGSSDIAPIIGTDKLRCAFCHFEWEAANFDTTSGFNSPIAELTGTVVASGAGDIAAGASALVTVKCQGCGAEVVINTESTLQARCHWCRQLLSLNTQIPNGAVPDAVLPFKLSHDDAVALITKFAKKRWLFALGRFKREFVPANVVGVYMPYMVVDGNLHADLTGTGEIKTREWSEGSDNNRTTYYDADVYEVVRRFDYTVDDLEVESSSSRADQNTKRNTNNVINAVLPFDTKSAVSFDAHYLGDFTSEKRDLNVQAMMPVVEDQMLSIARQKATDSAGQYDRGIRWDSEKLGVKGTRWVSVLLPIWLYSYFEKRPNGTEFLHYIAVNGRSGETMGSIPVSVPKLLLAAAGIGVVLEVIAIIVAIGNLFSL